MNISIKSLIPFEKAISEPEYLFEQTESSGKIVILKNNQPAYIVMKYEENALSAMESEIIKKRYTLQEAMKIVLAEAKNHTLHAADLAEIIYNRKLYLQKNGGKAKYNQVRARCEHYPHLFEALPGNYIKLRDIAR